MICILTCIIIGGMVFAGGAREIVEPEAPARIAVRSTQGQDINTLDPAYYRGNEEYNIDLVLYSKLMRFDAGSSDLVLDAAEWVEVSDDGLAVSFKLREGIQFHRGYGEMTAEDVKFSFERIIDPETDSAYRSEWITLDRVEVTGRYTGTIYLNDIYAPLFVGTIPFTPGSIISKKAYEELGDAFATNPVGSGPYSWAEWIPGQKMVLERFDDYFGDLPDFEAIEILPISEIQLAELALERGDLHATEISVDAYERFKADPRFEVKQVPVTRHIFIGFNHQESPFTDIRLREAVRYAVDIDGIIEGAYRNMVNRADAMIVEGVLGYWPDAPRYDVDLDRARELLAEAGYPDGFKTTITVGTPPPMPEIAQIVQSDLQKIGIETDISIVDSTFERLGRISTPGLFLANYGPTLEPDRWFVWLISQHVGSWNFWKFSNAEYDELREKALLTMDTEQRAAYYIRMQEILHDEVAAVWITNGALLMAHTPSIDPVFLTQRHQYRYWTAK